MKHPEEYDLHDADMLRIDTLEQEIIRLNVDLENARDKLAECEAANAEPRCDYGNHVTEL